MKAHGLVIYNICAKQLRKLMRGKRFNRAKAMKPLQAAIGEYWSEGIDALFAYMALDDGWEKLQRHVQIALAAETFAKTMSDADRKFLAELLSHFGHFSDVAVGQKAEEIVAATAIPTFEAAATFALKQIGVGAADFELKNEAIRTALMERSEAAIFATRSFMEETFQTITTHFYELGRNPYNQATIDELRGVLGDKTAWEAKRFALTETGVAAELAQVETYRRNGVGAKQWNILGDNTRPSHAVLAETIVGIEQKFNVGGFAGDHPLDPKLPAAEIVNCHCWLSPVVGDDFEIDPANLWEGA